MQAKIMNKHKEDQLLELNLIVTNSLITESEQYTNFPFEFEGIASPNKGTLNIKNLCKIRVAVTHDENVDREDDAAYYLFPNLKDGDFIKIRGKVDTSYKNPVVIISRKQDHIILHKHQIDRGLVI